MSKISIVFDRLRTEEKMLQKAAAELGHTAIMLDAKITQINTDSKKEDFDLGDVVLERCVSYFRGLHFTSALEFLDIPVLNKFDVASICGNKMFMTLLLKKNNIPTPKTYFSFSSESAAENLEKVGYPLVIKPVIGSWGRGVMPIKDKDAMEAIFEIRDITDRLDSVGNVTKANTKGYSVGSASLACFLLFSAYMDEVELMTGETFRKIDIAVPEIFVGGLLGSMTVFVFTSWSMRAVGNAAEDVIREVRR